MNFKALSNLSHSMLTIMSHSTIEPHTSVWETICRKRTEILVTYLRVHCWYSMPSGASCSVFQNYIYLRVNQKII